MLDIDALQEIPSYGQMGLQIELLNRIAAALETTAGTNKGFTALEQSIASQFTLMRTGKVYRTRFYRYSVNSTSAGTKLDDNAGLVCKPSTDATEAQDDYAQIPVFQWLRCNYTRDASDGFAKPSVLEGLPGFAKEGAVDVGTLHPTFYWNVEEHDSYYDIIISDTEHTELGLVPWCEAIRADGTIMPYWIESAYQSVTASDGLLRSQPGKAPAYNQSYNNMIIAYQKKGAGYWGAGIARNTYAILMLAIKYATKNGQTVFAGCSNYNAQSRCAVAETGVKRVLLASQGPFIVGGCVSVGVANGTNTDRGNSSMHSIADRVLVKSIETVTVSGTNYVALNLDIDSTITTTTDTYVSTMPQYTGTTDAVIGHHDGSLVSNTDQKHAFRIQGQEYMTGTAIICADAVMEFASDFAKKVYVAPRGTKHVADTHTGYALIGSIPATADGKNGDYWSGDVAFNRALGAYYPSTIGGGDSVGTGDRVWAGGAGASGMRELYTLGYLWSGSFDGPCSVDCVYGLGAAGWSCGSCD